jgi:hypothetical protein
VSQFHFVALRAFNHSRNGQFEMRAAHAFTRLGRTPKWYCHDYTPLQSHQRDSLLFKKSGQICQPRVDPPQLAITRGFVAVDPANRAKSSTILFTQWTVGESKHNRLLDPRIQVDFFAHRGDPLILVVSHFLGGFDELFGKRNLKPVHVFLQTTRTSVRDICRQYTLNKYRIIIPACAQVRFHRTHRDDLSRFLHDIWEFDHVVKVNLGG